MRELPETSERGRCPCGSWPRRTWEAAECFSCGRAVPALRPVFERMAATIDALPVRTAAGNN